MAGSGSFELHEDETRMAPGTIDQHRAIVSIMEELEAVDWYSQRVDAATDEELRAILAHNRDEELEHAAMVIEWLRRHNATFDEELRTYLFRDGPIVAAEAEATGQSAADSAPAAAASAGSLGIGSLKEEVA